LADFEIGERTLIAQPDETQITGVLVNQFNASFLQTRELFRGIMSTMSTSPRSSALTRVASFGNRAEDDPLQFGRATPIIRVRFDRDPIIFLPFDELERTCSIGNSFRGLADFSGMIKVSVSC